MRRSKEVWHTSKADWDEGVGKGINTALVPGDVILNMVKNMTKDWRKTETKEYKEIGKIYSPEYWWPLVGYGPGDEWQFYMEDEFKYTYRYRQTGVAWDTDDFYALICRPSGGNSTKTMFRQVWYFGVKKLKFKKSGTDIGPLPVVLEGKHFDLGDSAIKFGEKGQGAGFIWLPVCLFYTTWPYPNGIEEMGGEHTTVVKMVDEGEAYPEIGTFIEYGGDYDFYMVEMIGNTSYSKQVKVNIRKWTIFAPQNALPVAVLKFEYEKLYSEGTFPYGYSELGVKPRFVANAGVYFGTVDYHNVFDWDYCSKSLPPIQLAICQLMHSSPAWHYEAPYIDTSLKSRFAGILGTKSDDYPFETDIIDIYSDIGGGFIYDPNGDNTLWTAYGNANYEACVKNTLHYFSTPPYYRFTWRDNWQYLNIYKVLPDNLTEHRLQYLDAVADSETPPNHTASEVYLQYFPAYYWMSTDTPLPHWIYVDLGSALEDLDKDVSRIYFLWAGPDYVPSSKRPKDFKIEGSNNPAGGWTLLKNVVGWGPGDYNFENVNAKYRYIRIYITATQGGGNQTGVGCIWTYIMGPPLFDVSHKTVTGKIWADFENYTSHGRETIKTYFALLGSLDAFTTLYPRCKVWDISSLVGSMDISVGCCDPGDNFAIQWGGGHIYPGDPTIMPPYLKTAITIERGHPTDFPYVKDTWISLDGYSLEISRGTLISETFDLQPYELPLAGKMSLFWGEITRDNTLKQITLNRTITNIEVIISHSDNGVTWITLLDQLLPNLTEVSYAGLKRYLHYEARLVSEDATKTPALQDLSLKLDGGDCKLDPTLKCFVLDLKTGAWAVDSNPEITALCHWDGVDDKNEFYAGTNKGYIVKLDVDNKYADSIETVETDIETIFQSGYRNFKETLGEAQANLYKRFKSIWFRAEVPATTTITLIIDTDWGTWSESHTVDVMSKKDEYRVNLKDKCVGIFLSVKAYEKSQKSLKIYGWGVELDVLPPAYKKV